MTDTLRRDPKTKTLMIDGVRVRALAAKYGTPLYVYSYERLMKNFKEIQEAFAKVQPLVAYSMKTNSNAAVLRALVAQGAGLDIVSGGELQRGLAAGVDPQKVIYAGVGKTRDEIALALTTGIRAFNVESEPEALAIAAQAKRLKVKANICIRVNPDVDAQTHAYITTGKKENKFGIPFASVRELFARLAKVKQLNVIGLHAHIGSQITKTEPYMNALGRVSELLEVLRADGHDIQILNLGGGFGIAYEEGAKPLDVKKLARQLVPVLSKLNVQVIFEPGRSVAGPAGFLVTQVEYIKDGQAKQFAIVDGAMNDLIRPSLYSAYHRILPEAAPRRGRKQAYDVVGPICESGDFLGKDRSFAPLESGDLLVVCDAGAYGMVMASNYNSRGRAAEVLVKGTKHFLVRRRETTQDLMAPEEVPAFLKK